MEEVDSRQFGVEDKKQTAEEMKRRGTENPDSSGKADPSHFLPARGRLGMTDGSSEVAAEPGIPDFADGHFCRQAQAVLFEG